VRAAPACCLVLKVWTAFEWETLGYQTRHFCCSRGEGREGHEGADRVCPSSDGYSGHGCKDVDVFDKKRLNKNINKIIIMQSCVFRESPILLFLIYKIHDYKKY
jgi:hypothetical protein